MRTRSTWPGNWEKLELSIVLHEPRIAPNTGNIARLCAATGAALHLIEPLGFQLTDRKLRRAGLDYWERVQVERHSNWASFEKSRSGARMWFFTTSARTPYCAVPYRTGDALVFGSETNGLPQEILEENRDSLLVIPSRPDSVRSLNLSDSVSIVLYEALRQLRAWEEASPS